MLARRLAPANDGDLVTVVDGMQGMYDIGSLVYDIGSLGAAYPLPVQLSERVISRREYGQRFACRWDNDKIIGALNLTEPITCEK